MPFSRKRPRIAASGAVSVRVDPHQRDLLMKAPGMPASLGHALHRAPVREGKLSVRMSRENLDTAIAALARVPAEGRDEERELDTLLRYLETLADRFEDGEPDEEE
ncbi:MAG: hypothetical protein NVV63_13430 [Opitutus sp.]|nr:hypothetical protein [Opitutus sp.]